MFNKKAEADSFFILTLLLSNIKQNYLKGFDGVHTQLAKLNALLSRADPKLYSFLVDSEIDLFHFCFRWIFCLLLREFSLQLAIRILDYYLSEEEKPDDLCVFFCLVLLMKFSSQITRMDRDEAIVFLQKLPTDDWGEQDMEMLVAEGITMKNVFKLEIKNL